MIVEIKEDKDRKIITIVDDELIGNIFNEGELVIDLSSKYFDGEKKSEAEIKKILEEKEVYLVNFIGKRSVVLGRTLGLLEDTNTIAGIEYGFFLKMR